MTSTSASNDGQPAVEPGDEPTPDVHSPAPDPVLDRLRQAYAATIPGLTADLLPGTTLEELEANYAAAKVAFEAGRKTAAATAGTLVPAGAPGRIALAPESPRAKIRAGLVDLEVNSRV